ncbi:MAG: response regulator [Candidatus Lernaella stagnicola]|nr:response regulator [Candidatus Lernaella stagnicola]
MRKRILIVEDVEDNRDLLVQFFEGQYEIFEAADGQVGIAMAERLRPDLILMDLSLPVIDGWQATAALKADARTREIPIIAITAHAMVGDEQKALAAGCDGYISKPVDFNELERIVKKYLDSP